MLQQTLEEQGILGAATLSGTFVPTDLKVHGALLNSKDRKQSRRQRQR